LPLLYTELTRRDRVRVFLGPSPEVIDGAANAAAVGTGDLRLRGKYVLSASDPIRVAAAVTLRVPTGDEDEFQGTGSTGVEPMLYASSARWSVNGWLGLQAFLNAGLDFDTADVDNSEGRWGLGLDASVTGRVGFALEILGRHAFDRIAAEGTFDFPRCTDRVE